MRPKERIRPFLEEIAKLWEEVPDWRFGQLISNVLDTLTLDKFYLEDEQTLKIFKKYFKKDAEITKEEAYANLKEIVDCIKDEDENEENITAILDWKDLKSLKILLENYTLKSE